jgi:hypothetical protein
MDAYCGWQDSGGKSVRQGEHDRWAGGRTGKLRGRDGGRLDGQRVRRPLRVTLEAIGDGCLLPVFALVLTANGQRTQRSSDKLSLCHRVSVFKESRKTAEIRRKVSGANHGSLLPSQARRCFLYIRSSLGIISSLLSSTRIKFRGRSSKRN